MCITVAKGQKKLSLRSLRVYCVFIQIPFFRKILLFSLSQFCIALAVGTIYVVLIALAFLHLISVRYWGLPCIIMIFITIVIIILRFSILCWIPSHFPWPEVSSTFLGILTVPRKKSFYRGIMTSKHFNTLSRLLLTVPSVSNPTSLHCHILLIPYLGSWVTLLHLLPLLLAGLGIKLTCDFYWEGFWLRSIQHDNSWPETFQAVRLYCKVAKILHFWVLSFRQSSP